MACVLGGAPPPDRVFTGMRELNFNVLHIYGLTEVCVPCLVHSNGLSDTYEDIIV